jgi:hypothetical protein
MGLSYFGNVSNGKMILSEMGRIAYKLWYEIPEHFSFVSLDEFVVMSNHVHGIVIIQSPAPVGTLHATSLPGKMVIIITFSDKLFNKTIYFLFLTFSKE